MYVYSVVEIEGLCFLLFGTKTKKVGCTSFLMFRTYYYYICKLLDKFNRADNTIIILTIGP
jgi:hypothetical protein